ncbi:MAG: hypothetical protein AMXMBFR52_00330 [Burkholderiales bacterium]
MTHPGTDMSHHTVKWTHPDGTGGRHEFGEYESAFAYMLVVAGQSPQARVWFDDTVIQAGFDDRIDRRQS